MSNNVFVLPTEQYNRDIDIRKHYVDDTSLYLSKMTGESLDKCRGYVMDSLRPGGEFEFVDPTIIYLEREENGDRKKKEGKLSVYLSESMRDEELIAPTFTTYLNPKVKKSLLVDFIDDNIAKRSVAKKAMLKAEVLGNKEEMLIKNTEQTNKKLSNNSLSGAHVSKSTPLNNKTAHSTLTSNCRSTSGYGNANNEKFLSGNRHYWSPDITRNNIISIINHTDYVKLVNAMQEFGIRAPTQDETMECITRSSLLYWRTKSEIETIRVLVSKLNDLERAAVVYTGDLYHLMKYNDDLVRRFIGNLSMKVCVEHPDPDNIIKKAHEDICHLASQICAEDLKGKEGPKDLIGTPAYGHYASTVQNIINVIAQYKNLIIALWVTPNVPASLAAFPDSIRRCVLVSDTDSTIFTVQDWVVWFCGELSFTSEASSVAASMIFLAAQTIIHVLARMSANFGIDKARLFQISMKNEFKFDVFVPTQLAKHYYALIGCREGKVFAEYKPEIKGVHLKASNAPKIVMQEAKNTMLFIMYSILQGKNISMAELLKKVSDLENKVRDSIARGSYEYFKRAQIKPAEAYKKKEKTPNFIQYGLWDEVFSAKYGVVPPPPYMGIKVSTNLNKPTTTIEWLNRMEDKEIADKLKGWMEKQNKKHIGKTFILPEQVISSCGIPKEILDAVGVRDIILECTNVFYIILETLGLYILNDKITRLISDDY